MQINEKFLLSCVKWKLFVDDSVVLYFIYNNKSCEHLVSKIAFYRLQRKKFITEDNILTELGKEVYKDLFELNTGQIEIDFNNFWEAYPSSDKWANYPMTRTLRNNKVKSKQLYTTLMQEGVTPESILLGLNIEIETRKRISSKDNSMKFMQASSTWLNNRTYEAWLDKDEIVSDSTLYGKDLN